MVAGDRSAIDQETNETLQNSGLGHLLSVSGVHMGVVGGLVFAALLWSLALIPPLALRVSVKKLAAIGALSALAFYLVISGWSVPALRSFIMAGVAFGAILLDRPAISMRGLALGALIVVLLFPESVLEPGFQMSFAATTALVALFEVSRRDPSEFALPTPGPLIGALQWSSRAIGGVISVSLVAGLATDPFALYHFQRFSTYALAANLASAPIMSFLVAPAAGVAAVLAPFGLADAPLQVMAGALDLVAAIGEAFGSRPEAVRALPRPPDSALTACVAALLWGCVWRGRLRWGSVGFFALALGLYFTAPKPAIAFDADLRALYAQDASDGSAQWTLQRGRGRSTYALERLGAMLGHAPTRVERLAPPEGCGADLCAWKTPLGRDALFARTEAGLAEACIENAIVLLGVPVPPDFTARCRPALMIDAPNIATLGGGMIYETPDGLRVTRATPAGIARPWTPRGPASQE
jgi:competence protein ComEC